MHTIFNTVRLIVPVLTITLLVVSGFYLLLIPRSGNFSVANNYSNILLGDIPSRSSPTSFYFIDWFVKGYWYRNSYWLNGKCFSNYLWRLLWSTKIFYRKDILLYMAGFCRDISSCIFYYLDNVSFIFRKSRCTDDPDHALYAYCFNIPPGYLVFCSTTTSPSGLR